MIDTSLFKIQLFKIFIYLGVNGDLYTSNKNKLYLIKNDEKRDITDCVCDKCDREIKENDYSYSEEDDNVDICISCRNKMMEENLILV